MIGIISESLTSKSGAISYYGRYTIFILSRLTLVASQRATRRRSDPQRTSATQPETCHPIAQRGRKRTFATRNAPAPGPGSATRDPHHPSEKFLSFPQAG
jgi:hypothetical protein